MLKYVIFDLSNTLIDHHSVHENLTEKFDVPFLLSKGIKVDIEEYKKAKEYADREVEKHKVKTGTWDSRLWTKILCEKLEINFSENLFREWEREFKNYILSNIKLKEGAKEVLEYLKDKYNLILLTNSPKDYAEKRLMKFDLKKYFSLVITSEDVGVHKSSLLPFKKVLEKTGAKPEEHIMIGDRMDEDTYAKRMGIKTVILYDARQKYYKKVEKPDFIINNLLELKNIL